jgi:hypothetical protein
MQWAWRTHKPNLQRLFVEDLQGYDVAHRLHSCAVEITRCTKNGWKPQNQVHLEGQEEEVEEEREMAAYYKVKIQQEFERMVR